MSVDTRALLELLARAVCAGDEPTAMQLTRQSREAGVSALDIVSQALTPGIQKAGGLWEEGEYFLPELVTAAQAMKAAMAVLEPQLKAAGRAQAAGRVLIGTVEGDIHDIGKSLVATLLAANGFHVTDEGVGVTAERFVVRARETAAGLICASALLTTTMTRQAELVKKVREQGLAVRVMVGGAPVTQVWASGIGADGFADNAVAAVAVARRLLGDPNERPGR